MEQNLIVFFITKRIELKLATWCNIIAKCVYIRKNTQLLCEKKLNTVIRKIWMQNIEFYCWTTH